MSIRIALLILEIHLPHSHSLKAKRQVVRRVRDQVRNKFNVSIAETGHQDKWQRAELGIVMVSNDGSLLDKSLREVGRFIDRLIEGTGEVLHQEITHL